MPTEKRVLLVVDVQNAFCPHEAPDARQLGFDVSVIEAGCRGVDVGESRAAAWKQMDGAGVIRA